MTANEAAPCAKECGSLCPELGLPTLRWPSSARGVPAGSRKSSQCQVPTLPAYVMRAERHALMTSGDAGSQPATASGLQVRQSPLAVSFVYLGRPAARELGARHRPSPAAGQMRQVACLLGSRVLNTKPGQARPPCRNDLNHRRRRCLQQAAGSALHGVATSRFWSHAGDCCSRPNQPANRL